jgi:hypothetical protein
MNITRYTDNLPAHVGGMAQGPYIRIRPKYKDDIGLHRHEEEHVRQWWVATIGSAVVIAGLAYQFQFPMFAAIGSIGVHGLLYKFVPSYRLWAEVQAHKIQMEHYPDDLSAFFGERIATLYNLKITAEEAAKLLRGRDGGL